MHLVCLDFEGVLIPDIWPYIAKKTGIEELKYTTRDFKDYRELMERRVEVCSKNDLSLLKIQTLIRELEPYEGALEFVHWIRSQYQLIILSDTFYEFVPHFMELFHWPTLFCHSIGYNNSTHKLEYHLRLSDQKKQAVNAFKALNFKVYAAGDSYNDISMLAEAHKANLYCAPQYVIDEFPQFPNLTDYAGMKKQIIKAFSL